MKKLLAIFTLVICLFTLVLTPAMAEEPYKIGFFVKDTTNSFWRYVVNGATIAAQEAGVELIEYTPVEASNVEEQINLIEDAITAQVDAIPTGISGKGAVYGESGIQVQKGDVFFLGGLANQVVVKPQAVVVQVACSAGGGHPALVEGDDGLSVKHGVGLAGADGINGVAIVLIKLVGIDIAQVVDAEAQINLAVLLQSKGLQ